jgi:hypothetical protein
MITIDTCPPDVLLRIVSDELSCPAGEPLERATIADHIRGLIYGAWARSKEGDIALPIHTTRILASARRIHSFGWPQRSRSQVETNDLCADVLDSLSALGDVTHIGRGFWLPAPTTFVELDGDHHLLVTGSLPTALARTKAGTMVGCAAAFRAVARRPVVSNSPTKDLVRTIDNWLGHADPLVPWTRAILQQHEARLSIDMDIAADQLEVYVPEIFKEQRKPGRWMRAPQIARPLEGLRLCRLAGVPSFGTPHFLATFRYESGLLSLARSAHIAAGLSRRLRFGFDAILGARRSASITLHNASFSFDNAIAIPEREERILALGWTDARPASNDASRTSFFHLHALPLVLHALSALCITPAIIDRRVHV